MKRIGGDLPQIFSVSSGFATCLYLADVGLNSCIEYGDLPDRDAFVSFVQLLLQITGLVNLLVQLGGTFLFRSGLFAKLYSQFGLVLLIHPLYICLTIILGIIRANVHPSGADDVDIWDVTGYAVISGIHKLGALCYYACSIYAVEQLRNRKYYSHEYWLRT